MFVEKYTPTTTAVLCCNTVSFAVIYLEAFWFGNRGNESRLAALDFVVVGDGVVGSGNGYVPVKIVCTVTRGI